MRDMRRRRSTAALPSVGSWGALMTSRVSRIGAMNQADRGVYAASIPTRSRLQDPTGSALPDQPSCGLKPTVRTAGSWGEPWPCGHALQPRTSEGRAPRVPIQ
jgi:hypothetical protein